MQLEDTGNKILKIKIKNDKVTIETENDKYKICCDTFKMLGLDVGDTLTISTLKAMKNIERRNEILKYATNLLTRRPYSEKELIKKINQKFSYPRELKSVIFTLKKTDLLNEKEYLINYIDYFNKNYFGKYFIVNFFRTRGVKDELINSIKFDEKVEKEKALAYLDTIRNKYISGSFARQKRKIYDTMLERGFQVEIILEILDELKINSEVEKKQLAKSYKKYKEKYKDLKLKGVDAEAKIVSKLIECGYPLNLIQEIIKSDKEEISND